MGTLTHRSAVPVEAVTRADPSLWHSSALYHWNSDLVVGPPASVALRA